MKLVSQHERRTEGQTKNKERVQDNGDPAGARLVVKWESSYVWLRSAWPQGQQRGKQKTRNVFQKIGSQQETRTEGQTKNKESVQDNGDPAVARLVVKWESSSVWLRSAWPQGQQRGKQKTRNVFQKIGSQQETRTEGQTKNKESVQDDVDPAIAKISL